MVYFIFNLHEKMVSPIFKFLYQNDRAHKNRKKWYIRYKDKVIFFDINETLFSKILCRKNAVCDNTIKFCTQSIAFTMMSKVKQFVLRLNITCKNVSYESGTYRFVHKFWIHFNSIVGSLTVSNDKNCEFSWKCKKLVRALQSLVKNAAETLFFNKF